MTGKDYPASRERTREEAPVSNSQRLAVTSSSRCTSVSRSSWSQRIFRWLLAALIAGMALMTVPAVATAWSSDSTGTTDLNTTDHSCLDVANMSMANGAKVVQWSCLNRASQQWKLVSSSVPGYYAVMNANSGKCLTVAHMSTSDGADIQQSH